MNKTEDVAIGKPKFSQITGGENTFNP